MPTIAEAVAAGEQALFVGRATEVQAFERWLSSDPLPPEVLEVSGPGGIGKTSLLAAFRRVAERRGRSVLEVDMRGVAGNQAVLLESLGGSDAASAVAHLNAVCPLLLLDTFEEAGDLQRLLAKDLLPRLDTAVRVVIAGRFRLGHVWRAERLGRVGVRSLSLSGLQADASRAYLERRGVGDPRVVDQILRSVGGHPLALSLAADLAINTGLRNFDSSPERHLLIRSLAEQLLRNVADPELRELIEASAVVEQFDQSTLEAIVGRPSGGSAFEQLCRLSVVRPVPHGLMLHDEVRRILADDLRWRHREQYNSFRLRALEYYRERMARADPSEREWLLTQRLYLWEHAFVQKMLFGQDDPGEAWVEAGTVEDEREALEIEMIWHNQLLPALDIAHYEQDPKHDPAVHEADMARLLSLPGRRLAMARDEKGKALGYSLAVPICAQTLDYLLSHPVFGVLLSAYLASVGREAVPANPEASTLWYWIQLTFDGTRPEAVIPALWRDAFTVTAGEGVVLVTVFLKEHKELFQAAGFQPIVANYPTIWGMSEPTEGYLLDLKNIGLETWIESIMAGRQPPRALAGDELEQALQDALLHWRDDAFLDQSALANSTAVVRLAPQQVGAAGVRLAIGRALHKARAEAPPDLTIAYSAVEGAYLTRTTTHERLAEELAVSRTTFYRLLRRGVQGLAQVLLNL